MSTIAIQLAGPADIDALVPLFDAYRTFYGRQGDPSAARSFLADRFNRGESVILLARAGGSLIGFAQLYPGFSSVSLRRTFVLNDLFVAERHRRRGVGRLLLSAAVDYAKRLGALRLSLSTARDNASAQALYESEGWKRDDDFLVYTYTLER